MNPGQDTVSIIIPARNEAEGLKTFLPQLRQIYPKAEILVVNDGSTDDTALVALNSGAKVYSHPYSMGNGASIKTGARMAKGSILVFMDGDGQHRPDVISPLLAKFHEGYDMVVGARERTSQANTIRWLGNTFYNFIASHIVKRPVLDLTSGCRVVNAQKFREFLHLLPNGFSSPTTITMAFFRTGYSVTYIPIQVLPRIGRSHLRPFSDGLKFLLIIYKMTILYSPLKIFIPFAILHLIAGISNYAYTFTTQGRFTNMSAVLLSASVIIFLIGLISEQITALMYANTQVPFVHKSKTSRIKKTFKKTYAKSIKETSKPH